MADTQSNGGVPNSGNPADAQPAPNKAGQPEKQNAETPEQRDWRLRSS
jgi:hypothetical protein